MAEVAALLKMRCMICSDLPLEPLLMPCQCKENFLCGPLGGEERSCGDRYKEMCSSVCPTCRQKVSWRRCKTDEALWGRIRAAFFPLEEGLRRERLRRKDDNDDKTFADIFHERTGSTAQDEIRRIAPAPGELAKLLEDEEKQWREEQRKLDENFEEFLVNDPEARAVRDRLEQEKEDARFAASLASEGGNGDSSAGPSGAAGHPCDEMVARQLQRRLDAEANRTHKVGGTTSDPPPHAPALPLKRLREAAVDLTASYSSEEDSGDEEERACGGNHSGATQSVPSKRGRNSWAPEPGPDEWICKRCTLLNKVAWLRCSACDATR